jgi:hypothetical protein
MTILNNLVVRGLHVLKPGRHEFEPNLTRQYTQPSVQGITYTFMPNMLKNTKKLPQIGKKIKRIFC